MTAAQPRYVVTGASGWVGQGVLHALRRRHGANWASRVQAFGSTARALTAPDGTTIHQRALDTLVPADIAGACVLHLAFLGRECCEALGEAAFLDANRQIDALVAQAARAAHPAALFIASSGAAAMAERGLDPHPYGRAKLAQEARFAALASDTGAPLCMGRIYSLAGPYMNKLDGYALSSFLLQGLRTGRIRIEARRPVFRSYLHVLDLARLALAVLAQGDGWSGPLDLCGAEVLEMQDVARAAAKAAGLRPSAIQRAALDLNRPSAYLGDPVHTRTLALGHGVGLRSFSTQVADTARWLRATRM